MSNLDPNFATELEQFLRAASYEIIFDARTPPQQSICQFMAERRSADEKRAMHVSVYYADDYWSYSVWWALGNDAQSRTSGKIKTPNQLREVIATPWDKS